jgi:adenylosuccinate lyase
MADAQNPALTSASQWFERTLDDSANKRISVPEAFLATDAILRICDNVSAGIKVYDKVIARHLAEELPFMATENIMMNAVKRGGDRQELHEKIRLHSIAAGAVVKEQGLPNDLVTRIAGDPAFALTESEILSELEPEKFTGRAERQVENFLNREIKPLLEKYRSLISSGGQELKL